LAPRLSCNFDHSFNRRIVKADVPKISRHSTRKTCGSLLAALDVHPRVAMQILRHSKIAITMEIYTEVPSAVTREALRKLGQWLDEADDADEDQADE
jgi:integrase